jgi:hypothetical protein
MRDEEKRRRGEEENGHSGFFSQTIERFERWRTSQMSKAMTTTFPDEHDDPAIPEDLRQAVKAIHEPPAGATGRIDAAVLHAAGTRAAAIRQRRMRLRTAAWGGWGSLAAAAGLAMAVWVWGPARWTPGPTPVPPRTALAPKDINGDGRVDILDALALARIVEGLTEGQPATAWDFTGDGTVDQRDVEAVAAAAVRLGERG